MEQKLIDIHLENNSLFKKIAESRRRDGRHLVVTGDDGVSLYVIVRNSEIVGYEANDSEGRPVASFIMKRVTVPSANDPADFCLHCHYIHGHPNCYPIPCPP
jgi:hypothetical protein